MPNRKITASITAVVACTALSACSLSGQTHQSAPAGITDFSRAQVIAMPSGFRNVAVKCVYLQGTWFVVASDSDGGNGDNLPAGVGIAPDSTCKHYGG
jgi:hypothetical protein